MSLMLLKGVTCIKKMEFVTPEQVAIGDSCFAMGHINPHEFNEPCVVNRGDPNTHYAEIYT